MALRMLPGQENMACSDCDFYHMHESKDEGTCPEAAEHLRQEGWPKAVVYIEPHMSAESCPCFAPSEEQKERVQSWADEAADMEFRRLRDERLEEVERSAA